MRKALFLTVLFTLVTVVSAQAAESKIAIFNSRAVAARCEPFMAAQKKLEAQYGPEKNRLEAQGQQLQKQADDLQKQRSALSREAMAEKGEQFMRSKRNFEDAMQTYTRKAEAALIRVQQEFAQRLHQAAQDYGMKKGLTALFDSAALVYFDKTVDVTEDMIKEVARVYREGKPLAGAK